MRVCVCRIHLDIDGPPLSLYYHLEAEEREIVIEGSRCPTRGRSRIE